MGLGQSTIRLHEEQPHAVQLTGDLIDVAAQNGRQIRIHHRGVAARNQTQQRRYDMARRDLREPGLACQCHQPPFMRWVFPCMHHHNGAGRNTLRTSRLQRLPRAIFVELFDLDAARIDAAANFRDGFVQHRGQLDGQIEQPRPRLVANAQNVGETAVHQQQRPFALALQQRVGRDCGAHLHAVDQSGGDRCVRCKSQYRPDPRDRRIPVSSGIF